MAVIDNPVIEGELTPERIKNILNDTAGSLLATQQGRNERIYVVETAPEGSKSLYSLFTNLLEGKDVLLPETVSDLTHLAQLIYFAANGVETNLSLEELLKDTSLVTTLKEVGKGIYLAEGQDANVTIVGAQANMSATTPSNFDGFFAVTLETAA